MWLKQLFLILGACVLAVNSIYTPGEQNIKKAPVHRERLVQNWYEQQQHYQTTEETLNPDINSHAYRTVTINDRYSKIRFHNSDVPTGQNSYDLNTNNEPSSTLPNEEQSQSVGRYDNIQQIKFSTNSQHRHGRTEFEQSRKVNKAVTECPENATGQFVYKYDCRQFLNCWKGRGFVQSCAPGTLFNPEILQCDFPMKVRCLQDNFVANNAPIESKLSNLVNNAHTNLRAEVKCQPFESGLFAHPNDCSKFLNCANGQTFIQSCGPGTLFNPLLKVCDYPYNVPCKTEAGFGSNNLISTTEVNQHRQIEKIESKTWPPYIGTSNTYGSNRNDQSFALKTHRGNRQQYQTTTDSQTNTHQNSYSDYDEIRFSGNIKKPTKPLHVVPLEAHPTVILQKTTTICTSNYFNCDNVNCIPYSKVCDGIVDCPNTADERNCVEIINFFNKYEGHRLIDHDIEILHNTNLEDCAKKCVLADFDCRSFSYCAADTTCMLSDSNVGLSGRPKPALLCDYYEHKVKSLTCTGNLKCQNEKCLNNTDICNGVNDCGDRSDETRCVDAVGYEIRLTGSQHSNEGLVQVKAFGQWGYVCDDKFGFHDADVICKELGFSLGAAEVRLNSLYALNSQQNSDIVIFVDDLNCHGNESSLIDCDFSGWGVHDCSPEELAGVVCRTPVVSCPKDYWLCDVSEECIPTAFLCDGVSDCNDHSDESKDHCKTDIKLRLVNGSNELEGRVEVNYKNIWGTVCDDDFTDKNAAVVCQSLGFDGVARSRKEAYYGEGIGQIWLDQVSCFGNEKKIDDCIHWNWGEHNCNHNEDVGVICSRKSEWNNSGATTDYSDFVDDNFLQMARSSSVWPDTCGQRNGFNYNSDVSDIAFKVVQGSEAKVGEYPWQASIRVRGPTKSAHWCGAIIITQYHLLTAAHCMRGFPKGSYFVRVGDFNNQIYEESEIEANIDEIYIHEEFHRRKHMNNDIAVIKLKSGGIQFNDYVQPICLPSKDLVYEGGLNCTISGWGSIQSGTSSHSSTLRAGWIPLQPNDVCMMANVYGNAITDGMICAGNLQEGIDSCDGDSGGPLACVEDGVFTLYGITSWGQHCGEANKPGVYVKVAHYVDWIKDKVQTSISGL